MTRTATALGAAVVAAGVLFLILQPDRRELADDVDLSAASRLAGPLALTSASLHEQGFLYGRVTTSTGAALTGRLRWGGTEEAFWGDFFNGFKDENPWAADVPRDKLTQSVAIEILGFEVGRRQREIDLGRPFMARFGDIRRIARSGSDLFVTLKNGTVFTLDRLASDDLADGLRVWIDGSDFVDLEERQIEEIEFFAPPRLADVPVRLYGTVQTLEHEFTGFVQWNREDCVGSDLLEGRAADGSLSLPFGGLRSIERNASGGSLVTLEDGREIQLGGTRDVGEGNRGVYVDDPRYGRVLISWEAFVRVDFASPVQGLGSAAPAVFFSGPAYDDFPPGQPLNGTVETRSGRQISGRLVFDLDESQTTETLDAPSKGVDYILPFGLVASISPCGSQGRDAGQAGVLLDGGEVLRLECAGDLGDGNAGVLVFADGARPEYLPWADVERIELVRPAETFPALDRVTSSSPSPQ